MHIQELVSQRHGLRDLTGLEVGLQEVAHSLGMRIEVVSLLQELNGFLGIVGFQGRPSAQQQNIAVPGIEYQHALEDLLRSSQRTAHARRFCSRAENLPCFGFLAQPDVNLGELDPHSDVFRVHLQDLLEKPYRLLEVAVLHEVFSDLQVLRARVVEETLLGIEFRQFQRTVHARMDLGDLLVHRDAFYRETLRGIGIADTLETFDGFGSLAQSGVEVPDGVVDGEVLGIVLENLLVFRDGVLKLALLDKLFRSAEKLLFVKAETKRHRSADSSLDSR